MIIRKYLILLCLFLIVIDAEAQENSNSDIKVLYRKEWSMAGMLHTGGYGITYRHGKHLTGYSKRMFEIEFSNMKHPKETKTSSYHSSTKSFIYGKLNTFNILRTGIGRQKIINGKPYWGGVELRWFTYVGASLGFAKPVYLYIVKYDEETGQNIRVLERFDPTIHYIEDIDSKGPFIKGIDKLSLYPGLYAKTGLNFEYGAYTETLRAIECGVILDVYPREIPIMAYNENKYFFLSLYIGLNFGQRKN